MVRIIDVAERTTSAGENFYALILQGDLTFVRSSETGRLYATAKKASIPSTFDLQTCQALIGRELPGQIKQVQCEPYEYTLPESGEVIQLSHRYEYFEETA